MWRLHQLHQVSYTIKRKPLSALSNVLRKLRHHTASIHEIRHQYEKVRTNTISNVYNSKQGDKGTGTSHGKMHYKVTFRGVHNY